MVFEAAIFDLDGTLVDAYASWKRIFQGVLADYDLIIEDNDFTDLYSMTYHQTIAYLHKRYLELPRPFSLDDMIRGFNSAVETEYAIMIKAKPYALDYVKGLYNQGVRICVATLTGERFARLALSRLGFLPYIEFIITGEDVGKAKDSPEIFIEACTRLSAVPAKTVVFEDSLTAARTAKKAGFIVCGVYDENQTYEFFEILPYADFTTMDYKADTLALCSE